MPAPSTHSSGDFSFLKADSLAILESSQNGAVFRPNESDNGFHGKRHAVDPLRLDVSLRLGRILALTTIVVSLLLLFVVVFRHGVELTRFPVASKSETEKSQLLDSYNSYSGTLVSIVGRPLEIFVALLMQVVVVRCAAVSMLRPESSLKAWVASLVLSASVGYLLNNGFNALNVQLRSLEIEPVISLSDLTVTASSKDSWMPIATTSNETHTVSEAVANNSIANTVLRNLVLPREPKAPLICPWPKLESTTVPDDLLEYGFPARDWQARLLSTALEPQRLHIIVNASNSSVPRAVPSADLPMNASRAAELFMHGLMLVGTYIRVNEASFLTRSENPNVLDGNTGSEYHPNSLAGRVAYTTGLLPNDTMMSETKQREWFLQRSQAMMGSHFRDFYKPAMGLDFTHVQVSPSIAFDAVTFEVQANTTESTITTVDNNTNCGPWPALCQFAKPTDFLLFDQELYDPAAQIHAFALCVNEYGIESLRARVGYSDGADQPPTSIYSDCGDTSNSSLLVVSVGKRLVADTLQLNVNGTTVTVTKMRKIFSITFGRLEWTLTKLSEVFNATCEAPRDCLGLQVDLSNSAVATVSDSLDKKPKQLLLVSADALPLSYVVAPIYDYSWDFITAGNMRPTPRSTPLVKVHEPPRPRKANVLYDILAGDLLLPHNIRDLRWNTTALNTQCNAVLEDRQQLVIKNHLYIEHSLQPAYTAAVFFLLQNGVVKDTITVNSAKTSLNFDANRQNISLWVSIPKLNAWLTLAGCGLMAVCVLTAIVWTVRVTRQAKPDPLTDITMHHVIARIMLDETQFPSLFLRRHVLDASHPRDADSSFQIESMRLCHSSPPDHFVPSSSIQYI